MATLPVGFKTVNYSLNSLICDIDEGSLALPDLQRPFVWKTSKVRDLLDSLFQGFPVGYFLFWENSNKARNIGVKKDNEVPHRLIIDGQQRLTSLYAVIRGRKVVDENYKERTIQIAFKPRHAVFAVANAATARDPEWINNISDIWTSDKGTFDFINDFMAQLVDGQAYECRYSFD